MELRSKGAHHASDTEQVRVRRSRRCIQPRLRVTPFRRDYLLPYQQSIIPDCGDTDSSAAPSALEDGAYIPLDHRTFLQWMSQWPRTQHESGSASFGISRLLGSPGIAVPTISPGTGSAQPRPDGVRPGRAARVPAAEFATLVVQRDCWVPRGGLVR
jgi:hypothetical protein